jgi:hypothetical protein
VILAPADWALIAVTGLAVGLALIALAAIYSSMPSPRRAISPPPDRPGVKYTCYCYSRPVRVLIEAPRSMPRPAARPAPQPDPQAQTRGRHAKRPPEPPVRPFYVSHAGADGGGRDVQHPVPVAG